MVELTALLDIVGLVGFLTATGFALLNYRDADAESGFWVNFAFASLLGVLWTGTVAAEHLGLGGAVLDVASVSLLTATTAVYAVGAGGTILEH